MTGDGSTAIMRAERAEAQLANALAQQAATAEVLRSISSATFDLDTVLGTLVKSATELCGAANGIIFLRDGDFYRPAQQNGLSDEDFERARATPIPVGRGSATGRAAESAAVVHIPDVLEDPDWAYGEEQKSEGYRTLVSVPLLLNRQVLGVFTLARLTPSPFNQREIDMVETFSDQAVIAIENARLFAEIQEKNRLLEQLRKADIEYLGEVAKLTRAARVLERGKFSVEKLGMAEVAARGDALGTLAKVFTAMAQEVYERERRLRRNIRTANGTLLLLACGGLWGLAVPISKLAMKIAPHPVGLAVLVEIVAALTCLSLAIGRKVFPSPHKLKRADWSFFVVAALLGSVVNQVLMYWMASKLPAFLVVIVIVLEGFAVFIMSAFLKIEMPTTKRLIGLGLGLAGVCALVWTGKESTGEAATWLWMLVALAIPLTYAAEDLYISVRRPAHFDVTALNAYVYFLSVPLVAPIAFLLHDFIPIELLFGRLGVYVLGLGAVTSIAMILFVRLIATAGPVFAGQNAYAVTAAGICWSILLVNEHITLGIWAALATIVIGLLLVEPQREADPEPPAIDDLASAS